MISKQIKIRSNLLDVLHVKHVLISKHWCIGSSSLLIPSY